MNKFNIWYLYLTVFVAGTTVLVLEILGSRIISPYFGNTLYVWSSLLSVAIASLAIGYYIGGWIADKWPKFDLLYFFILLAGVAIFIVPKIDSTILVFASEFGVRFGSLLTAVILFSIPIVLLGTIAPFAIRLRTEELQSLGTSAGSLYATETLGGFFGSLITGFYLLPSFGVNAITTSLALLLFIIAGFWLVKHGMSKRLLVLIPIIPLIFISSSVNKDNESVLYVSQSMLGELKVIEKGPLRILLIDGATQAYAEKGGLQSSSTFYQRLPFMYFIDPSIKDVLVIGLGSGMLSRDLRDEWNADVDTVDFNKDMLYIAQTYFGFDGTAIIEDARTYIRKTEKKYDAIVYDAADGDGYATHLFSQNAFSEAREILNEDGIIVINFKGHAGSMAVTSIYRTLDSLFENVLILTDHKDISLEQPLSGKLYFATNHDIDKEVMHKNITTQISRNLLVKTYINLLDNFFIEELTGGIIVTDDYNPLDYYQLESTTPWRERNMGIFGDLLLL